MIKETMGCMPLDTGEVTSTSIEKQRAKIVRLCKAFSTLLFIIALSTTGMLITALAFFLLACIVPAASVSIEGDAIALLPTVLSCCSLVLLVWVLWTIVRTMVKTGSPFSAVSEHGMAILSILYCLLAGVYVIPSESVSILIKISGITAGFVSDVSGNGRISVTTIGAAIIFAVLTVVFKYGALLQRVSDDVV